ncbi:unnamed protein product, partial [Prorocentrum cordatum]
VRPDHLQPLAQVQSAGLRATGCDTAAATAWLRERAGKEVAIGGARGVPTHFVAIAELANPQGAQGAEPCQLRVRSVRDGEEVTFARPGAAPCSVLVALDREAPAEVVGLLGAEASAEAALSAALLLFCRALHVTEMTCDLGAAGDASLLVVDAQLQIDEAAGYLAGALWGTCRFPVPFGRLELPEEAAIHELDSRTGASLKFTLLNRLGRVWTLIAGGGASVVYTDTICEYGFAKELANYGEYSGDPPEEFVYEYARTILSVMTSTPEPHGKILLIGGGVANFTDVASTFKGIVKALRQFGPALKACGTSVWVRRGGPNYSEGLALMRRACEEIGVPAKVYGPEAHITSIVRDALASPAGSAGDRPQEKAVFRLKRPRASSAVPDGAKRQRFSAETRSADAPRAIVYGMQTKAVQRMLDFDTLCGRKAPSVAAIINPTGEASFEKFMFGSSDVLVPVYPRLADAVERHGKVASMLVNFASFRSVHGVTMDALQFSDCLKTHAIIAEGVPEALTRRLHQEAAKRKVDILGPATVGGIAPGRFRIGNAGGAVENLLLARLYRPGSVAYTTKSGGMSNELNNIVALNTDGVREGIAIGGDRWPGLRFLDVLLRFEADPAVKMMALLGEVGGREEYGVADAIRDGRITKPVVAWCCGTAAEAFDYDVQFGHAGARARSGGETAGAKNRALAEAGAFVPDSFDGYGDLIARVYRALVDSGEIEPQGAELPAPALPADFDSLKKKGLVRKPASFVCSISDDRGAEPTYAGVPISEIAADAELGVGGAISLLWFRRRLPAYVSRFMELCVITTADHGPCVSGAHNTIVAARAGKDLVSSLISGLATISGLENPGLRYLCTFDHSGASVAVPAAAAGCASKEFVEQCKAQKKVIVWRHFAATPLLDFALAVEQITTRKKANLILNVDGAIAVCFVDLLRGCGSFSKAEADELVENGVLNGLFVASRTLGLVGHFLDQRRLKQPLYRHPQDDVTYIQ